MLEVVTTPESVDNLRQSHHHTTLAMGNPVNRGIRQSPDCFQNPFPVHLLLLMPCALARFAVIPPPWIEHNPWIVQSRDTLNNGKDKENASGNRSNRTREDQDFETEIDLSGPTTARKLLRCARAHPSGDLKVGGQQQTGASGWGPSG
jgi:hypothetical protein